MQLSKHVLDVLPSATFRYSRLARGKDIIDLTVGRPNFDTPESIKNAAITALREGKVHYTETSGIPELRESIAKRFSDGGVKSDKDSVIVSCGAKHLIYEMVMSLVDNTRKVAFADPSWVSYEGISRLAGGRIEWLPTNPSNGFIPDESFMKALEASEASLLLLNSPNNPTGAVYPKEVIEQIAEIAERNHMWVMSDETYSSQVYDGEHFSIGRIYPNTVVVGSFSKEFSMTGWRVGYANVPEPTLLEKMVAMQEQTVSCTTSFAQFGALACFKPQAESDSERMSKELNKRRDLVMERMKELRAVCVKPGGAFYVFPYFPGQNDVSLANILLSKNIGVIPGSPFGSRGRGCLRISYGSVGPEDINRAFDVISKIKGMGI